MLKEGTTSFFIVIKLSLMNHFRHLRAFLRGKRRHTAWMEYEIVGLYY